MFVVSITDIVSDMRSFQHCTGESPYFELVNQRLEEALYFITGVDVTTTNTC